ncbi:MAG TPA: GNAT family N-acetyltransferase [Bacilli bacterium]|nr:MAG: putative acetyltransferase [Tenericutes bacterium ADurb.BinA124]HNZ49919.1 GNAT family N-acetyltransferase [Bacilli bacterium]HPX84203.1 GNAT family N-acetyltransferase [Bacilli bacterium]HQC74162.1 GNAT family N-acetyltransferase [Bacilli bacterium]
MVEIKAFEYKMMADVVALWNESVAGESIYAAFTMDSFTDKFINNPFFRYEGAFVALKKAQVVGFACASINNQGKDPALTPGYIVCVAVDYRYQRQGLGTKLLLTLEAYLKSQGKTFVRNLFFNPINLEWLVPGYDHHEHPGAPAIPYNTPYYFLMMANGYNTNGQLDAYHLDLKKFRLSEDVKSRIAKNEADGYTITYYDPKLHYGFDELFDALKNEGWREVVKNNLAKAKPDPMLIVQKEGEILGWTGPVITQASGRGYLGGIGVHPKTQGHGLGKSLFCMLCQCSKDNGATFMTLFTGADNKAREIYLYAGMRIVQSFAVLRKELH